MRVISSRAVPRLAVAAAIALLVAACGVRPTQLEPPPDANPAEVRDPLAPKIPPRTGEKPDKPFVLDGLLM